MRPRHNPLLVHALPKWRSRAVLWVLLAGFGLLGVRAVQLQAIDNDRLQAQGEARFVRSREIPAPRGTITDRNGAVLAKSLPAKSVYAGPAASDLKQEEVVQLAKALDLDASALASRLGELRGVKESVSAGKGFIYLRRQVSLETADKVSRLRLAGINLEEAHRREYPTAETAAHVLGFTDVDDRGQEGVELAFNRSLSGSAGVRKVIQDRRGAPVEELETIRTPRVGGDIALSIDNRIQFLAYARLKEAVDEHNAKGGGVVVLDVHTGEVLALANLPTYDPNRRARLSGSQLRNRALTDSFEPGSTLKPFTIALALDKGRVTPATQFQTAPGRMTIGGATISDAHPHGVLTVSEIIQKSSNVGSAKVGASLAPKEMWDMYGALGFGHAPKLGFPGESAGQVRPYASWRPIEQATMSFGHGIAVSLVQLARSYLAFARTGDIVPLSLTRLEQEPEPVRVFSPSTARDVRAMMETVVQTGGTALKAQVPGYRVAGKTGTARKLENGQYQVGRYVSSFVGFAPVSNPRLVVAVMLDEPSGAYYGGEVAAPAFSQIMGGALRALEVQPDAAPALQADSADRRGRDRL